MSTEIERGRDRRLDTTPMRPEGPTPVARRPTEPTNDQPPIDTDYRKYGLRDRVVGPGRKWEKEDRKTSRGRRDLVGGEMLSTLLCRKHAEIPHGFESGHLPHLLRSIKLSEDLALRQNWVVRHVLLPRLEILNRVGNGWPVDPHRYARVCELIGIAVAIAGIDRRLDLMPPATRHEQRVTWSKLHVETFSLHAAVKICPPSACYSRLRGEGREGGATRPARVVMGGRVEEDALPPSQLAQQHGRQIVMQGRRGAVATYPQRTTSHQLCLLPQRHRKRAIYEELVGQRISVTVIMLSDAATATFAANIATKATIAFITCVAADYRALSSAAVTAEVFQEFLQRHLFRGALRICSIIAWISAGCRYRHPYLR